MTGQDNRAKTPDSGFSPHQWEFAKCKWFRSWTCMTLEEQWKVWSGNDDSCLLEPESLVSIPLWVLSGVCSETMPGTTKAPQVTGDQERSTLMWPIPRRSVFHWGVTRTSFRLKHWMFYSVLGCLEWYLRARKKGVHIRIWRITPQRERRRDAARLLFTGLSVQDGA